MAPPPNDNFASAITITGASGSEAGTVFDATREASESSTLFGGTVARSVWYKWTCPSSGWYRFFVPKDDFVRNGSVGGNQYWCGIDVFNDDVLTAHTSTTSLASSRTIANEFDDPPGTREPTVAYEFISGNVYYIRLASMDQFSIANYSSFDFVLEWIAVSTPANDLIANATDLDPLPATVGPFSTRDNTPQSGEQINLGGVGSLHQSQWYKFTPTTSGRYSIVIERVDVSKDNKEDSTSHGRIYIGTMSGTTLTLVPGAGNISIQLITGPPSAGRYAMYADLVASTEYYIIVCSGWEIKHNLGYHFNGQTLAIDQMVVELVTGPINDNFASPTNIDETALPVLLTGQTTLNAGPEAGENFPFTSGDVQAVWYDFTPDHDGLYRFRLPLDSLEYAGDESLSWGEILIALTAATDVTGVTGADFLPSANAHDAGYSDPSWIGVHSPTVSAHLTNGVTYRCICWSAITSSLFNRQVMNFDLEVSEITPPSNDDFANRTNFSGASGTQPYQIEGATDEVDEPYPFWWREGVESLLASVWFDWTAPSSDWYEFRFEGDVNSIAASVGIYTGAAINALTPVARNEAGTRSEIDTSDGCTTIKFLASSGTNYKFQLAMNESTANTLGGTGNITWAAASAPTGETTSVAEAAGIRLQLVDNFGNTDDELPPDAVTRLTPHGDFYYNDGQVGRSKWWKFEATTTGELEIVAEIYKAEGFDQFFSYSEHGILVYKGANFASLTDASTTEAEDAVMLGYQGLSTTINGEESMFVSFTPGDTIWVCLVGLYDADGPGGSTGTAVAADCPQLELHLTVDIAPPENDTRDALLGALTNDHRYWIGQSRYFNGWTDREAQQGIGSTLGATTTVGDPDVAGFTATRNVWFMMTISKAGFYRMWIESSVDCVLGIYRYLGTTTLGALIAEDDDSGVGNQPEIIHEFTGADANFDHYWVCVDSKTAGEFVFNMQRQSDGTPPANDNVADAIEISSFPFSHAGTTIDATAEPAEIDAVELGEGPKDSVWYKFVATGNGNLKITATDVSTNIDAYVYIDCWRGTTVDDLERWPDPPPDWPKGVFIWDDTPAEIEQRAVILPYNNGETYFIRVQTEEGGSEDFTIHVDEQAVYIDIQASGSEEMHGTLLDDAEIYINIQVSSVEVFDPAITEDSGTVYVDIQPSSQEFVAEEFLDADTVYFLISIDSHDCQTTWSSSGIVARVWDRFETSVNGRWLGTVAYRRFDVIAGDGLEEC